MDYEKEWNDLFERYSKEYPIQVSLYYKKKFLIKS